MTVVVKPPSLLSGYWQLSWSKAVCQLLAGSVLHPEVDPPNAHTLQSKPFEFLYVSTVSMLSLSLGYFL